MWDCAINLKKEVNRGDRADGCAWVGHATREDDVDTGSDVQGLVRGRRCADGPGAEADVRAYRATSVGG